MSRGTSRGRSTPIRRSATRYVCRPRSADSTQADRTRAHTPPARHGRERGQGKTVEVGRAAFETEKKRYTILDAPGHKAYVPNMIGGAAQADIGVLVVSARKGEFEAGFDRGGQTREHVLLAKTAGVRRLVIAINKMDDPTVNWEKERCGHVACRPWPRVRADRDRHGAHFRSCSLPPTPPPPQPAPTCSYDEIVNKLAPFLKATGFPKSGAGPPAANRERCMARPDPCGSPRLGGAM